METWRGFLDWLDESPWRWAAAGCVCLAAAGAVGRYWYVVGALLALAALAYVMGDEHAKKGKG